MNTYPNFEWVKKTEPCLYQKIKVINRERRKTHVQLRHPAIIGAGRTQFGEHYEREPEALIEEAGLKAFDAAGIERRDLDACFLADYFLPFTNKIGLEEGFF